MSETTDSRYPHLMCKDGITHIEGQANEDFVIVYDQDQENLARDNGYLMPGETPEREDVAAPTKRGRQKKADAATDEAGE